MSIESLQGEIPEGSGLVIAETLSNGTRIVGPVRFWTEIVLWRQNYEGEEATFSIDSLSYSLSTQAYLGAVPAGTYRVGLLYAHLRVLDTTYTAHAFASPAIGTFEVKAGQVTNLGTILYQPFQDRNRIEDAYPDYAITRIENGDLWHATGLANPEIAAKIDAGKSVLGWSVDSFDVQRDATAQLMKDAALPTKIHSLSDGGFLLSGLYGGLYSLDDGELHNRSMTSHYEVTDLVELPTGQLLIGSEFGKLSLSSPSGDRLRDISIGQGISHVLDIDLSNSGQAYVITFAVDGRYGVYRYDANSEALSLLKSLPKTKLGFFERGTINYAADIRHPIMIGTRDGIAVFVENVVLRYNEEIGQWSESEGAKFNALYRQLDGYVSGIPHGAYSGSKPMQYSVDGGNSWKALQKKAGMFGAAESPTYRFADGELVRTGEDIDFNFFSKSVVKNQVPVLSTQDEGVNWAPIGAVPRGCVALAVEASTDELLYILCTDGGIVSSKDRGRTWQQSLVPRIPDFDAFPGELKLRYERD